LQKTTIALKTENLNCCAHCTESTGAELMITVVDVDVMSIIRSAIMAVCWLDRSDQWPDWPNLSYPKDGPWPVLGTTPLPLLWWYNSVYMHLMNYQQTTHI